MKSIAEQIFDAWQQGEKSGSYERFKSFLSESFILFSHPLIGKFVDKEAFEQITKLIKKREQNKNQLTFSDIIVFENENAFMFQFNSKGMVENGKFPYEGYNIILLTLTNDKLKGFQEYFGFIDPSWFKN
jgi:hypothetical protein